MLLKEAIEENGDLRRVIERVEPRSGPGRRALREAPYLRAGEEIRRELELVERAAPLEGWPGVVGLLSRVKDVRGTIRRVAAGERPDDVELFEIKNLALLAGEIADACLAAGVAVVEIPSLEAVVALLDPDGHRLPHFYIYDSYSPALASLRARLKEAGDDEALAAGPRAACLDEEERIRGWIGERLRACHRPLSGALEAIGRLDLLLAKANLARETGACKPDASTGITRYEGLFHPLVREALRAGGREFQPVDVAFGRETCLITGANMGGKTVLLKSLALAQALFQFGFHVPAAGAAIVPVDEIFLHVGDGQDATRGLSSFAAEMLHVDRVARAIKGGSDALVLLDEPARGTNPAEGVAIVDAIVDFLTCYRARALVTTHYGGLRAPCRKLRVRGLARVTGGTLPLGGTLSLGGALPLDKLHELMDYSLVEDSEEHVPEEAVRVAKLLGVDEEIIKRIKPRQS